MNTSHANLDPQEVAKFSASASRWWDETGDFRFLHQLNPLRVEYLESQCGDLKGKRILDLGCGGGILSEALAEKGAKVTGIDASEAGIQTATLHLYESGHAIDYRCVTVEDFVKESPEAFDFIVCMEMLEHVPNPESILKSAARILKPGGKLVLSTINRTPQSFLKAIIGAEYILRLIPRGTHHYDKFIRPGELTEAARRCGLSPLHCQGLEYRLLKNEFALTPDVSVNYFLTLET